MNLENDKRETGQDEMPTPPGGDADRHPGSPAIGSAHDDSVPARGDESSGHPHSGRRHEAAGDEELPGEWREQRPITPPEGR
jgi:hypothetical protein